MKIVARTNHWGPIVYGLAVESYSIIDAEVDLRHEAPMFVWEWGCCPPFGKRGPHRVVEISERHFLDEHNGKWSLFLTSIGHHRERNNVIHEFILIPDIPATKDCKSVIGKDETWKFFGHVDASIARMDLEVLLKTYIKEYTRTEEDAPHVHVRIVMKSVREVEPRYHNPSWYNHNTNRLQHKNRNPQKYNDTARTPQDIDSSIDQKISSWQNGNRRFENPTNNHGRNYYNQNRCINNSRSEDNSRSGRQGNRRLENSTNNNYGRKTDSKKRQHKNSKSVNTSRSEPKPEELHHRFSYLSVAAGTQATDRQDQQRAKEKQQRLALAESTNHSRQNEDEKKCAARVCCDLKTTEKDLWPSLPTIRDLTRSRNV